jgi:hypothetical protein
VCHFILRTVTNNVDTVRMFVVGLNNATFQSPVLKSVKELTNSMGQSAL